jgi:chromosome segregation ATPase
MINQKKCEKCGKDKRFKSLDVKHTYQDRNDEFQPWVVESVKIDGFPVIADICLECGNVNLSINPEPLKEKLNREEQELMAKQKILDEKNKIRIEFQNLKKSIEELSAKTRNLERIEKADFEKAKNVNVEVLNGKLSDLDNNINTTKSRIDNLLQQQKNKLQTLKELGIHSENNPKIIEKIVEEYEEFKLALNNLEIGKKEILTQIYQAKQTPFTASEELKVIMSSLAELYAKQEQMVKKYGYLKFL